MWGKLNEAEGKACIVAKALPSIELSKRNQARTMLLIVETLQSSIASDNNTNLLFSSSSTPPMSSSY